MASPTSSGLTFPHPDLTVIRGEPTNTTLRLLKKELYANARQIHSTRGGGTNGHLRLLMTPAAYLARAGVAFDVPVHPGNAPVHAPLATAAQIAETIRLFTQTTKEHKMYLTVHACLKQQLLKAVDYRYLQILEDPDYSYADVTPLAMLEHLETTYGQITPEDIEKNHNLLSGEWSPDSPIEDICWNVSFIVRIFCNACLNLI